MEDQINRKQEIIIELPIDLVEKLEKAAKRSTLQCVIHQACRSFIHGKEKIKIERYSD